MNVCPVCSTGSRAAPCGPWTSVDFRGSTCSFFSRGKNPTEMIFWLWRMFGLKTKITCIFFFFCLFCLLVFQVISLRDQIKRRQQGVDGGKDVREGFLHVGSSCSLCLCYVQKVRRKVDVWVTCCVLWFYLYLIHLSHLTCRLTTTSTNTTVFLHINILPAVTQWSLLWPWR